MYKYNSNKLRHICSLLDANKTQQICITAVNCKFIQTYKAHALSENTVQFANLSDQMKCLKTL